MAQSSSPIPRTQNQMSAMEHHPAAALRSSYTQTVPPRRRGLIKLRILKGVVKSATSFASLATGGFGHRNAQQEEEHGGPLSSPPDTPTGYNSDA